MKSLKILSVLTLFLLASCGKESGKKSGEVTLDYSFDKVVEASKNSEVNIYMYGGSNEINKFMDEIIAKNLKEQNGIKLNRVPFTNIKDTVNKLITEKDAGKNVGSIDVLWVNGENFKALKDAGVTWGDFSKNLPNIKLVKESTLNKDFGEDIDGLEAPWGEAQFNFIYNGVGEVPFTDATTLMEFTKKNPGKFTYPTVIDHTGSAFVRNIAMDILGYENILNMSDENLKLELNQVWSYFNEMKPNLWRNGETYPEGEGKLDSLFKDGEVLITMGYTVNKVNSKIAAGLYDKNSKSFLLDKGTLFNNHYLMIPGNAPNKNGALYVVNYLMSPEAQLLKQDPINWGDFTILDLAKVSNEEKTAFDKFLDMDNLPKFSELSSKRVPELAPSKLKIIEDGWLENVGKTSN